MFHTVFMFGGSGVHCVTQVNSKRPFHKLQLMGEKKTRLKFDVKNICQATVVKCIVENKPKGKYLKFHISDDCPDHD